jgi:hypothetical protein
MSDILLTTLNARYIHAAFGLRYLMANLGELQPRAAIVEFDINQRPLEIVEAILGRNPRIVGFGVYIWNVALTAEVVAVLKRLRPGLIVILGGPLHYGLIYLAFWMAQDVSPVSVATRSMNSEPFWAERQAWVAMALKRETPRRRTFSALTLSAAKARSMAGSERRPVWESPSPSRTMRE